MTRRGFGLIELLVGVGLFAILGVTGLTMFLHSQSLHRLGDEQSSANNYAQAGLEIARSLRNQSFSLLVNGTHGTSFGTSWSLAGTSDSWGKYTRTLNIQTGQRDGSGNVVASGGTADPDLKKITSTVTYDFGPTRQNVVTLTSYLTNYLKPIVDVGDGLLVYGNTTTTPPYRTYTSATNSFSTAGNTAVGAAARGVVVATSPTQTEAITGYLSSTGNLHLLCFDGSSWSQDWVVSVGGTGTTRRYDLAYESTTGKAMVVYSTNTATTNELAYRTKTAGTGCGAANWSAATNLDPVRTSGIVHWVGLADDRRSGSNLLALLWADANRDLSAMLWNGSAWVNEPTAVTEASLEIVSVGQDVRSFDLAFESLSGDLMLVWGNSAGANGVNGVRYRTCPGGTATCSWGAVTTPPTFSDDATNLDLAADPTSDAMVFASVGNAGNDLQIGYWSGSAWTNTANADTTCTAPVAGGQKVAVSYLNNAATRRSVVVYDDNGAIGINWFVGNAGSFAVQADFAASPTFVANQGNYQLAQDPGNRSELSFIVSNIANDLFAKRLVMTATPSFTWTNSDGSAALETNLSSNLVWPAYFAYWRNQ